MGVKKTKVHDHGAVMLPEGNGVGRLLTTCEDEPRAIFVKQLKAGAPVQPGDEIAKILPIEGDDEHVEYTTYKVPDPNKKSRKGPAKVSTDDYRDGWERVFAACSDAKGAN